MIIGLFIVAVATGAAIFLSWIIQYDTPEKLKLITKWQIVLHVLICFMPSILVTLLCAFNPILCIVVLLGCILIKCIINIIKFVL